MVSFRVLASRYRDLVDLAGADPAAADGSPRAWGWCRAANSDTEVDTCLGRVDAPAPAAAPPPPPPAPRGPGGERPPRRAWARRRRRRRIGTGSWERRSP